MGEESCSPHPSNQSLSHKHLSPSNGGVPLSSPSWFRDSVFFTFLFLFLFLYHNAALYRPLWPDVLDGDNARHDGVT